MTTLIDPTTVHRRVLPNGLTVLMRRDDSAPVVAMVTHVRAGYFDETDDMIGISHVLEHMYFKGTPRRGVGEIAKQTKAVGGYLNAATIYDHTSYYTVVPASGFVNALDIQADAYANSLLDPGELARELEVIIQEAKRKADSPSAVATETLYELLHDRHRMRRWRIGREEGLRGFTRAMLAGFYRNFYRPSTTILSVVGAVDVEVAMREIEARYGAAPAGDPVRSPSPMEDSAPGFRYRELNGDVAQSQLVLGWRTVPAAHIDTPALDMLGTILGTGRASRLYRAVREEKLASQVSAYHYTPTDLGVFVVHAEGSPATTADAAQAVWREILGVREHEVAPVEVERAQRILETRVIRRLEDMEGQASHLAEWEALGGWQLADRYFDRMMSLTAADLMEVARRYLDPAQASVVIYRPTTTPEVAPDATAIRERLGMRAAVHRASERRVDATPPVARMGARFEREEYGVRVYRTSEGVPILVRLKPGTPIAHLGVIAVGGASEEAASMAGLTGLMARTAVKGTARRSAADIAEAGELLGGSVSAGVSGERFGWSISVPMRRYGEAVALLADVVQHATFSPEALDTERNIAMADVVAMRDDMFRYPMRLAAGVAFAGHPYGVPVGGTEESLRGLTVEQVRAWHRERALTSASVIAIVGDMNPDALADEAARAFTELRFAHATALFAPHWPAQTLTAVEPRDKAQTALLVLFPGPSRSDDDRFVTGLIASVASGLGGRFFDALREEQSLAYTVHAFASEHRVAGTFGAYIATSPEKEEMAREGLLVEFAKLRETPITADELERAQTYALGAHAIRQQRGSAVLGDVVDAWLSGRLAELSEFEGRVRAVTRDRALAVAQRYFDPARRVEGVVRGVGRTV